jgi:ankyrin repeat protein
VIFALLLLNQTVAARPVPTAADAVRRALPVLERSAKQFVAERSCVSCHHNILPIITLRLAASRGFAIDAATLATVERKTFRELTSARAFDEAVQGAAVGDPTPNDSWLLIAAQTAGLAPDLTNAVVARRIASWQHDGHWTTSDFRPPHSSSLFTSTATAVRAIRAYLPDEMRDAREAVLAGARDWLTNTAPASTEDATFRLLGLVWADAPREAITAAGRDLEQLQRAGGGWAQLPAYAPDAYSTGEALYALHEAGMSGEARWRRGIAWLRSTQAADGTWRVRTRMISPAEVSPPYFTTGFPYRKDEYISYAATNWATLALLSSLPGKETASPPAPVTTAVFPPGPAFRWALFGASGDAAMNGVDVNATTANGTSLLMAAAADAEKVRRLLARGADARYRAPSGYDALTVAASYRMNAPSIDALLDGGAEPEPPEGAKLKNTPLLFASMSGDLDTVSLLLSRGAQANPRPNPSGDSPISEAITFGRADVVRALINAGAKVDLVESTGINLLHWAAITNRAAVIPELARAGVDIDAIDEHGFTPLMYAATIDFGDTATLDALLRAGADRGIRNGQGRTPRAQALYLRHQHLAQALR